MIDTVKTIKARRLGHNFVGAEHFLLGLVGEGTGIAAKVLKSMGINLKDARVEVEKIIGRGSGFVAVEIPFTPRAKRVLELSLEEARQLGHNYIGSENLLLGLLHEGEGVAARVLENLDADPNNIRTQVIRMVGESAEALGAGVGGGSSTNKMPTLEEFVFKWSKERGEDSDGEESEALYSGTPKGDIGLVKQERREKNGQNEDDFDLDEDDGAEEGKRG